VLGIVPIVKLVLGDIGEFHRRDQQPFRHGFLPYPLVMTLHCGEAALNFTMRQ
jgi:hypothetical protein